MFDPGKILVHRAEGDADIDVRVSPAHIVSGFFPVYVRCHFIDNSSTGTKVATMTIRVQSYSGSDRDDPYDCDLASLVGVGLDNDATWAPRDYDVHRYYIPGAPLGQRKSALRIQWTHPDSGKIYWGLEVGMYAG